MSENNQINYYLNHCIYYDDIDLVNDNELLSCIKQLIENNITTKCGSYYDNKQLYLMRD